MFGDIPCRQQQQNNYSTIGVTARRNTAPVRFNTTQIQGTDFQNRSFRSEIVSNLSQHTSLHSHSEALLGANGTSATQPGRFSGPRKTGNRMKRSEATAFRSGLPEQLSPITRESQVGNRYKALRPVNEIERKSGAWFRCGPVFSTHGFNARSKHPGCEWPGPRHPSVSQKGAKHPASPIALSALMFRPRQAIRGC